MWEFPMPPVKTGDTPRLVKILARRRVGLKSAARSVMASNSSSAASARVAVAIALQPVNT